MTAMSERKSNWIPWVFVGAMGVVVAVNAVMVTYAIKSWSGLAVSKPYERGVAYNEVLQAQHRQDALGWTVKASAEITGADRAGRVLITVLDRDGRPLQGQVIEAELQRPVEVIDDVNLTFTYAGEGRYVAPVTFPKLGQWDLRAAIVHDQDTYQVVERLFVK